MDGAILVVSALDSVMPQTREHVLLARAGGFESHRGVFEQVRRGGRPGDAGPGRDGSARASEQVQVRRGQRRTVIRGAALPALNGDAEVGEVDRRADGCAGHEDPGPGARHRQAVFDGGGGRVLDQGPWDCGDGSSGAGRGEGGRGSGAHRIQRHAQAHRDGRGDVPQALGSGSGGGQHRCASAGD